MSKKKIMIAYMSLSIAAGLALAICRTVILYRYYDPYNGEFSREADLYIQLLGYGMLAVVLILFTSYFWIRREKFEQFSASSNQVSVFSSSLCGFIFAAVGILVLIYYAGTIFQTGGGWFFKAAQWISFFSLFGAAAYFIFSASVGYGESKIKKALSFFPALWALSYLAASYIHPDYLYNDPNRIFCNVSIAALLLFFLFETRNTVSSAQNPARFAFSLIAMVCVLVYMLPLFTLTAFWEISLTPESLFEAVECGAVFYIFAVLYTMISAIKKEPAPVIPTEASESGENQES